MQLAACHPFSLSPLARRAQVVEWTMSNDFQRFELEEEKFSLVGYVKRTSSSYGEQEVHVYIEGDGKAWVSRSRISLDPTPINPLGLKLALQDPASTVIYLGRPCQFLAMEDTAKCSPHLWGKGRYEGKIVAAMSSAIDWVLLDEFRGGKPRKLVLFGYSGGGVMAALIAAQRNDIGKLVTIASPLDMDSWTKLHKVDPVTTGYTMKNLARQLSGIPQIHFAGASDKTVPPVIIKNFAAGYSSQLLSIVIKDGFTHQCCWLDAWPEILLSAEP